MAAPASDTLGVNDRVQLATAHQIYNRRLLDAHMRAGVTVVDPATTWIDADVRLAPDVTLHPSGISARRHGHPRRRGDRSGRHVDRHLRR